MASGVASGVKTELGAKTNGSASNGVNGSNESTKATTAKKQWILNAFAMNTPGHLSPGLWKHPRNRTQDYTKLSFWTDLAKILDDAGFHALVSDAVSMLSLFLCPLYHTRNLAHS
jgi:hypothetical protein